MKVMNRTMALATLVSLTLTSSSHASVTTVDHYTFDDNVTPAGVTEVGTPTYSDGSLILNGSSGLKDGATVGVTDNFGIEVVATFSGAFPAFSFPLALTNGANNGFGVVSIGSTVSGHGNSNNGPFGGFIATIGTEYHFAVVRSGGTSTFYVDGLPQAGTNGSTPALPTVLTIGYNQTNTGGGTEGFLTGSINEVRTFTFAPGEFNPATDLLVTAGSDYTWDGAIDNWNSAHWNPGLVPGPSAAGYTATISSGTVSFARHDTFGNAATPSSPAVTVNEGGTLNSGGWFNTIWDLNLNGGTLTVNGGDSWWGAFGLAGTVTVGGSAASTINLGDNTTNARIDLRNAGTTFEVADVTGNPDADLTISAPIGNGNDERWDAGSLIKSGAGTMILTAANTYSGTTTVTQGTLAIQQASLKDTAGVVIAAGGMLSLDFDESGGEVSDTVATLTINGVPQSPGIYGASGSGADPAFTDNLHFSGVGTLTVTSGPPPMVTWDTSSAAGTQPAAGTWGTDAFWSTNGTTLTAWPGAGYGALFGGADGTYVITVNGSQSVDAITFDKSGYTLSGGNLALINPATLTANANATIGSIIDTGGLTKDGGATLLLTAENTYGGATTVTAGILEIAAGASLSNTNRINAYNDGMLTLSGGTVTVANDGVFAVGSSNGSAGTVCVDSGTLNIGNGSSGAVGATYIGGKINNTGTAGTGTLTINGGVVNVAAGGGGSNGDASRLWLNPYGGSGSVLALNGGTLSSARPIANGSSTPASFIFNGGTLQAAADVNLLDAVGPLTIEIQAGGASIDSNGFSAAILPAMGGTGGLTKTGAGTLTLSAAHAYTGDTTVNVGTLAIQQPYLADASNVVIAAAATLALNFNEAGGAVSDTVATLTLDGVQAPAGIYGATGSGADPAFTDDAHFAGAGTLTVTNGPAQNDYATWIAPFFPGVSDPLVIGDAADPDGDGMINHEEYAFGLLPNSGSSVNPITVRLAASAGTFTYTRRNPALTSLSYTIWTSTDLVTWSKDATAGQIAGAADGNGVQPVFVTLSTPPTSSTFFVQVRAN